MAMGQYDGAHQLPETCPKLDGVSREHKCHSLP